jgi:hypothetical protein
MKKKRESGKTFNGKGATKGVDIYHEGEYDAYNNLGNHNGKYAGHLKKCYQSGYLEGQQRRAFEKNL